MMGRLEPGRRRLASVLVNAARHAVPPSAMSDGNRVPVSSQTNSGKHLLLSRHRRRLKQRGRLRCTSKTQNAALCLLFRASCRQTSHLVPSAGFIRQRVTKACRRKNGRRVARGSQREPADRGMSLASSETLLHHSNVGVFASSLSAGFAFFERFPSAWVTGRLERDRRGGHRRESSDHGSCLEAWHSLRLRRRSDLRAVMTTPILTAWTCIPSATRRTST